MVEQNNTITSEIGVLIDQLESKGDNDHDHKLKEIMDTPDVHNTAMKIPRAKEVYKGSYEDHQGQLDREKPAKVEVVAWILYEFFSHFIHTVLVPIVFPLIISQIVEEPPEPVAGWTKSSIDLHCDAKEMMLYQRLTHHSIGVNDSKFSPLGWTSISWAIGLLLVAPIITSISLHLDRGRIHQQISAAAIGIGVVFCLPTGAFKTVYIFPIYIAVIIAAHTIASTCHTRYLAVIVHGFTGTSQIHKSQFPTRAAVSSWISTYSVAAGSLGSAVMSGFTYHMLGESDKIYLSLWIVSIFSGLKWALGIVHVVATKIGYRAIEEIMFNPNSVPKLHVFSTFKYPQAIGSLIGTFLSSFTTMCIFTGGLLYIVGKLCFKPLFLLYFWLTYFIFPLISLPLLQPLQHLIKADAVKMQVLGFLLSAFTCGMGFYYKDNVWGKQLILGFAAIQSTSNGILHAFGRVLILDCSPIGKEGAFSTVFSWVRALGMCIGFIFASSVPGNIKIAFGVAFSATIAGIVILIFGNISNLGAAIDAGLVRDHNYDDDADDDSKVGSPVPGLDTPSNQRKDSKDQEEK